MLLRTRAKKRRVQIAPVDREGCEVFALLRRRSVPRLRVSAKVAAINAARALGERCSVAVTVGRADRTGWRKRLAPLSDCVRRPRHEPRPRVADRLRTRSPRSPRSILSRARTCPCRPSAQEAAPRRVRHRAEAEIGEAKLSGGRRARNRSRLSRSANPLLRAPPPRQKRSTDE
jgi:hypothetical protein